MHVVEINGRRYAQFEELRAEAGLLHAFSTRPADLSPRPGRDQAFCAVRRQAMVADLRLDPRRLRYCGQVHEGHIVHVSDPNRGGMLPRCDGVLTGLPGTALMCFSADCPLVLLYDPACPAVGLAHAGWRCTVAGIVGHLVERMVSELHCERARLRAAIGPGAGPCCYEVQQDVLSAAADLPDRERLFPQRDGHTYFDLWEANRLQLVAAGVPPRQIEVAGVCTMCAGHELFFSFRREGRGCGHFGLLAALAPV